MSKSMPLRFVLFSILFVSLGLGIALSVSAQSGSLRNISFSNHEGRLTFLDRESGRVYLYNTSGELEVEWQVNQLGQPLARIR